MPDVKVQTEWTLIDKTQEPLRQMNTNFGRAKELIANAGMYLQKFGQIGIGLAGIGAAGYGIGAIVKSVINLGSEIETTTIGIATMLWQIEKMGFGAKRFKDFTDATKEAGEILNELRRIAAESIGETHEYIHVWRALSIPIAKAGADMDTLLHLTKLLVPTSKALGVPLERAVFDIKQMFMGISSARDEMVHLLDLSVETVNQLARTEPLELLRMLQERLERNSVAVEAYGETWEAKLSTLKDMLKILATESLAGIFDIFKTLLEIITTLVESPPFKALMMLLRQITKVAGLMIKGVGWAMKEVTEIPFAPAVGGIEILKKTNEETKKMGETVQRTNMVIKDTNQQIARLGEVSEGTSIELGKIKVMKPIEDVKAMLRALGKTAEEWEISPEGEPRKRRRYLIPETPELKQLRFTYHVIKEQLGKAGLHFKNIEEMATSQNELARNFGQATVKALYDIIVQQTPELALIKKATEEMTQLLKPEKRKQMVDINVKMEAKIEDVDRIAVRVTEVHSKRAHARLVSKEVPVFMVPR